MNDVAINLEDIKAIIPDFAKDIRLNLERLLSDDGAKGLSISQRMGVALSTAYATQQLDLIRLMTLATSAFLSEAEVTAAKSAASIMAMNNVYYRTINMIHDPSYKALPTGLRMQVILNPGISKEDFELYSLAVSAVNGCEHCVDSHVNRVVSSGVAQEGVHTAIRIAAVMQAAAQAIVIQKGV
jgi:lipoyl-dependent peroxiredoxin subunit D